MDENRIAYTILTLGVTVSFLLFILSAIFAEFGYGSWLVMVGVVALTLTPFGMVFVLLLNYILRKDYMWFILCTIILSVVLLSAFTTYLLG